MASHPYLRDAVAHRHNPIPAKAGIGLRFCHHKTILRDQPHVAWWEVHSENYMGGGEPVACLERVRQDYPVSLHGVGLSLGSADGLEEEHLARLVALATRIEPGYVSEHLSFSTIGGHYLADLLPLPMTEEALEVVCRNVQQAQERLKRKILVENPSTYLQFRHSTIPEAEFLAAVADRTGCGVLLDVNNVFVSARNHGWDMHAYLAAIPAAAVGEIHLAGHASRACEGKVILIDDHGSAVAESVWSLFEEAVERVGPVPTLIERDNNIPDLAELIKEADRAESVLTRHRTRRAQTPAGEVRVHVA